MNESRRIVMFSSFSFSSIFVWSTFFAPGVVHDLDALPLFEVVDDVLPDDAVVVRNVLHLD